MSNERNFKEMLKKISMSLVLLVPVSVLADIKQTSPQAACSLLAEFHLSGKKWTDRGDGTAACASDYQDIGDGIPLANTLAFFATGAEGRANQVELVLNYNQPHGWLPATKVLLAATNRLSQKALGAAPPPVITKAILAREPVIAAVGSGSIEVVRDGSLNGQGYEIHVIMK